jgi:hypothetical protein
VTTARPNWFYNEFKYSGVDYTDPGQVAVYDKRHQRFRDYKKFAKTVMARLGLEPDATVIDLGVGRPILQNGLCGGCFRCHAGLYLPEGGAGRVGEYRFL